MNILRLLFSTGDKNNISVMPALRVVDLSGIFLKQGVVTLFLWVN